MLSALDFKTTNIGRKGMDSARFWENKIEFTIPLILRYSTLKHTAIQDTDLGLI